MRRRELLVLAGGALTVPLVARTQPATRSARIGYLAPGAREGEDDRTLFSELARLGYARGGNLEVVFEGYGDRANRLPELTAELVRARVDLIVAVGAEVVLRAARAATQGIPIVAIAINYDPVERGYAAGFAHPGGNVTGVFFRSIELVDKQVELMRTLVPSAKRVTAIWGAETAEEFAAARRSAAAQKLAIGSYKLGDPPYDFESIFAAVATDKPPLVLVLSTPAFAGRHSEAAAGALRHQLATMWRYRDYVDVGGLMSYGVDDVELRRLAAGYIAKILGGVKPGDLPIERADKFELAINLKTANALGIAVPPLLLARADAVIQ